MGIVSTMSLRDPPSPVDHEGSAFWSTHFKTSYSALLFSTIFDVVTERFRNREFAVFSSLSLLLSFFYSTIFNDPESSIYCTNGPYLSPTTISSPIYKGLYVWFWLLSSAGNLTLYTRKLYHCGFLWVAWSCICVSLALAHCQLDIDLKQSASLNALIFILFAGTHYIAGYYWLLGYMPGRIKVWLSPLHWVYWLAERGRWREAFKTPVQVQVALFLGFWALLTLFVQVISNQSLQTTIVLFEVSSELTSSFPSIKKYVTPIPYALLFASLLSFLLNLFSLFSLYHNYRKALLRILSEGRKYAVQFMAHTIYFYLFLVYLMTTVLFVLFSEWFYQLAIEFIESHPLWLPLFIVPTGLKLLYLPRLAPQPHGTIRNKTYFAFWDLIQATLGIGLGLVRGLIRYVTGVAVMVAFAYRSHKSIYSERFQRFDPLYTSYCGLVVIHCLRLGIEPTSDVSTSLATDPSSRSLSVASNTLFT